MTTRLAVLGSPIAHSLSPMLHAAAYGVLGLDWRYEAIDVRGPALREFVETRDADWRGLSLTMPLKRDVLELLTDADQLTELTGGANTVVFDRDERAIDVVPETEHSADSGVRLHGFNTDVAGIVAAFADVGVTRLGSVQVLGGGATAASVLVAARALGAETATVSARTASSAERLGGLGQRIGLAVAVRAWGMQDRSLIVPDAVISTVPGGTPPPFAFPEVVRASAVLFDVAYDPWPSELATAWLAAGGTVVPGIRMLVHQALRQVRAFVSGDPQTPLDGEDDVLAAMFASVGVPRTVGGF